MGLTGYFAALIINTLMALHDSDVAQISMIMTCHYKLLYMKYKISGGSCQTNRL